MTWLTRWLPKQFVKFLLWADRAISDLLYKYDICEFCNNQADAECVCGKRVCADCQDYTIYSDENCCVQCAKEIREGWERCPKHEFDEPYENDLGNTIRQCLHCDYPELIQESLPFDEPRTLPFCVKCNRGIKKGQTYSVISIEHDHCPSDDACEVVAAKMPQEVERG